MWSLQTDSSAAVAVVWTDSDTTTILYYYHGAIQILLLLLYCCWNDLNTDMSVIWNVHIQLYNCGTVTVIHTLLNIILLISYLNSCMCHNCLWKNSNQMLLHPLYELIKVQHLLLYGVCWLNQMLLHNCFMNWFKHHINCWVGSKNWFKYYYMIFTRWVQHLFNGILVLHF